MKQLPPPCQVGFSSGTRCREPPAPPPVDDATRLARLAGGRTPPWPAHPAFLRAQRSRHCRRRGGAPPSWQGPQREVRLPSPALLHRAHAAPAGRPVLAAASGSWGPVDAAGLGCDRWRSVLAGIVLCPEDAAVCTRTLW